MIAKGVDVLEEPKVRLEPGRDLSREILGPTGSASQGERADAQIDAFISKRQENRRKDEEQQRVEGAA